MHFPRVTKDHQQIRTWVEERHGHPARIIGESSMEDAALYFDFPDAEIDEALEEISWDDFFEQFDRKGLVLAFQEGQTNRRPEFFCKLIEGYSERREDMPETDKVNDKSGSGPQPEEAAPAAAPTTSQVEREKAYKAAIRVTSDEAHNTHPGKPGEHAVREETGRHAPPN